MKTSVPNSFFRAVLVALSLGGALPAQASLIVATNANTLAGRNAFLAAGTTQSLFNWNAAFNPGSFTPGQLGPNLNLVSYNTPALPNSTVNTVVGVNGNGAPLSLGNWIDGDVFDSASGAAADLAINGIESFDLVFGSGHRSIGLAIASGTGNLPREFDLTGAQFTFRAFDAALNEVGAATVTLAPGSAQRVWLTLNADSDFRRIEIREVGAASIADQYFSNIYASVEQVPTGGTVPEPGSLALAAVALALAARVSARPRR